MSDTPAAGIISVAPASARRMRDRDWRVIAPSAFLLLVVTALVLLPFANVATVQRAHDQMRRLTEPGRAAVTAIHVALALEGSLLGDYAETRDSTILRRYDDAVRQEKAATRKLAPLVPQLGSAVRARFGEMERRQEAWHRLVERGLASPGPRGARAHLEGDAYEDVLLAAARLDEAIADEADRTRSHILDLERAHRRLSVSLALRGLAGAGVVVWLARRLRLYAVTIEERARLMRGISHDIKNPLHAIDGHAQLLQDEILGALAPRQHDSVTRIRRGVRSVLALVGDLLELSRAEAGQLSITRREVDLGPLLHEVIAEHEGAARAAGHHLAAAVGHVNGEVVTDAERVRQVLGNLLSNAVKYTPRGGAITVRLERRQRPDAPQHGEWVAIDVIDTGPGVPEHLIASIFEEFSRLPMHAEQPGVGLGLAIARRIAGLLDGGLTVQNARSGSGACFTLWLPPTTAG
jgi:signal transduction histidine kinase